MSKNRPGRFTLTRLARLQANIERELARSATTADTRKTDLEDLAMTVRTTNTLRAEGFNTLHDILSKTERDILRIPQFGRKCFNELRDTLQARGYTLTKN